MKSSNRDRILTECIELFNKRGVSEISTNHISRAMQISPGNLYFHFRNKEAILRELFNLMTAELYSVWETTSPTVPLPEEYIVGTFEIFWKYRFFHREMYALRRRDPILSQAWRRHLKKIVRLVTKVYHEWVKQKKMKRIMDPKEMRMITHLVMITANSFLQFFESPESPARRAVFHQGVDFTLAILKPYELETLS